MSEFEILFKRGSEGAPPLWQVGCPILIEAWQISRRTIQNEIWVQTRIQNISSKSIKAGTVRIQIKKQNGETKQLDLNLPGNEISPGASFEFHPQLLNCKDISEATALVEKVVYKDGNEWKSSDSHDSVLIERQCIQLTKEQLEARAKILQEHGCSKSYLAQNYRFESYGNWWLCACGRINYETEKCSSCSISKQNTGAFEDKEQIEKTVKEIRDTRELQTKKKTKNIIRVSTIATLFVLLVIGIGWFANDYASTRNVVNLEYLANQPHDEFISILKSKSDSLSENDDSVDAKIKSGECSLGNKGEIDPNTIHYTFGKNDSLIASFEAEGKYGASINDIHDAVVEKSKLKDSFFSGSDKSGSKEYITAGRCKINDEDAVWYVYSYEEKPNYKSYYSQKTAKITIIAAKLDQSGESSSYEGITQKLSRAYRG